jgi:phosphonate transport system substrate-binding protein
MMMRLGWKVLVCVAALCGLTPCLAVITFGVISADSAGSAKSAWDPLFADLSKKTGLEIVGFYAQSYESVSRAVADGKLQVAFMSGRAAIDAIDTGAMEVFAQVARTDGTQGYKATLLVRKDSGIHSLADIAARPGKLVLARAEPRSVSGYLFAEQAFLSAHLSPSLHFRKILTNGHLANALAVATLEADVAANNTVDFVRFLQQFPEEHGRLKVIWESTLIPHAHLLWRRDMPAETKQKLRAAILSYGAATGPEGKRQDSVLTKIHNLEGFVASTNSTLLPILEASLAVDRIRSKDDQSMTPEEKRERLKKIEQDYARIAAKLK